MTWHKLCCNCRCFLAFGGFGRQGVLKMKTRNITKWLGASLVFGLLSLASQRVDAILEMSYTTDSPYLLGTVFPGQVSPPDQAAHEAAMTHFFLATGSQTHTSS